MRCIKSVLVSLICYLAILFVSSGAIAATGNAITGKFNLIDHQGNSVTESSYKGKYRIVFFGFTDCPVVCPTTMGDIARIMRLLGEQADQVQPLFITIDPETDTVSRLANYMPAFHPSIIGLTGSSQQIKEAAKGFNATYGSTEVKGMQGQKEIFHSSYLYLMDRDGQLVDLFGYGTHPERIVEKMTQYFEHK